METLRKEEKVILIFDVDGTLTPPVSVIEPGMVSFFEECIVDRIPYCLVTGSDPEKTIRQVGEKIFTNAEFSFNCNGNEVYRRGRKFYEYRWVPSTELIEFLEMLLKRSEFQPKSGRHIEERTGMLNFSIPGRNSNKEMRRLYSEYDRRTGERQKLKRLVETEFPDLEVSIGGEISIDIHPKGRDKSSIIQFLPKDAFIVFFGDRCEKGGNDYPLVPLLEKRGHSKVFSVKNHRETLETLKKILKEKNSAQGPKLQL